MTFFDFYFNGRARKNAPLPPLTYYHTEGDLSRGNCYKSLNKLLQKDHILGELVRKFVTYFHKKVIDKPGRDVL